MIDLLSFPPPALLYILVHWPNLLCDGARDLSGSKKLTLGSWDQHQDLVTGLDWWVVAHLLVSLGFLHVFSCVGLILPVCSPHLLYILNQRVV